MINRLSTKTIEINSGESLLIYLKEAGLKVEKWSGIPGSQNCIYLPDKTSFNWKSQDGIVRINCKENARRIIEASTNLQMFHNGAGDTVRSYSVLIDNEYDLEVAVSALKLIEGNSKR